VSPAPEIDILMWADYEWCYREDIAEMNHRSDDYRVIVTGSPEWEELTS
jgi:hypothetical protein